MMKHHRHEILMYFADPQPLYLLRRGRSRETKVLPLQICTKLPVPEQAGL